MRQRRIQRYLRHGTLPQLRLLEAVIRLGSLTRAAEELHIAQPTASLHLKKLGDAVGLPLLERSGKRIRPTAAGRALGAACREILGTLTRLEDTLTEVREPGSGLLRIAAGTTATYIVPRLLAEFVRRHPRTAASVQVLSQSALLDRLREDADDLYLLTHPPHGDGIAVHPVLPNPFIVLARRDHALARVRPVPLARFAEEPLLVREPGSATRAVAERVFAARSLRPRVRMELGSNEAIKEAILAGLGVAILARYSIGFELDPRLAVLDVEGFPVELRWHFAYPAVRHLSPLAQAFLDMVKLEAASLLAPQLGGVERPSDAEIA
ncbi:MAG: LysR family transcriptional regulator [Burkholderiales bacterium]